MALATTANPADYVDRIQTTFSRVLRESLEDDLVRARYATKIPYASNQGGYTLRIFRPRKANTTGINSISLGANEATTPTTKTEVAVGYVDIVLSILAGIAEVSSVVSVTDIFNTVKMYADKMKEDAMLKHDEVLRDAYATTGVALSGTASDKHVRFCGVDNSSADNAATRFASFHALSAANALITRGRNLGMLTKLKDALVPTINGRYAVVIPYVMFSDLMKDTTVTSALTNVDADKLWARGFGMLDGAVFVENSNPFRLSSTFNATHVAAGVNYCAEYLGRESMGCPEITGKRDFSDPRMPTLTILRNADKNDPNNLKTVIAWKSFWGAKTLFTNESSDVPHFGLLFAKTTALAE